MHLVLEILWTLAQAMYFWLEGIVLALLPASLAKRKDVAGEKVLITGAGGSVEHVWLLHVSHEYH